MRLFSAGLAVGLAAGMCWAYPERIGSAMYNLSIWWYPELGEAADLATEIVGDHQQAVESRARRQ